MKSNTKKKTRNGWSMIGKSIQWLVENEDLSINEKSIYMTVCRYSFGYKHRFCYLRYTDFDITNRNTIKKTIDSLVAKGIMSKKSTYKDGKQGLNEYKIIEPKVFIDDFIFIEHKEKKEDKEKENSPW